MQPRESKSQDQWGHFFYVLNKSKKCENKLGSITCNSVVAQTNHQLC